MIYAVTVKGQTAIDIGKSEYNLNRREVESLQVTADEAFNQQNMEPTVSNVKHGDDIAKLIDQVERNSIEIKHLKDIVSKHAKTLKEIQNN